MQKIPKSEQLFGIRLGFRCPKKWKQMKGGRYVRHCDVCDKNVYNISMLSRKHATELIQEKEGKLCVVFYQRPDGTIVTQDCVSIVGTQKLKARYNIFAALNAGIAWLWLMLLPVLGPAAVTIIAGGLPMRAEPSPDNNATIGEEPQAGDTFIWPDIRTTDDLLNLRYVTNKASKEKQP